MRPIRRGARGPAVAEIRGILRDLGLLPTDAPGHRRRDDPRALNGGAPAALVADLGPAADIDPAAAADAASLDPAAAPDAAEFDAATETAVRAFQQSRGLSVDGEVDEETWRELDAARWRLGQRALYHAVPDPLVGDDVRQLQERLLEMGYDLGRPDGVYGASTARAVAQFQREVGLAPDGSCGPQTLGALRRLGRKVVGGRPLLLREAEAFRASGPALVGKRIVIDPGHGGARWRAALDRGRHRVRPGRAPGGPARRGWHAGAPDSRPAADRRARYRVERSGPRRARQPARRGPVHLGASGRASEPGRRRRGDLPLRVLQRRDIHRWRAARRPGPAGGRRPYRHAQLPDPRQDVGAATADPDARSAPGHRVPHLAR